jgi:hypothetical protein
METILEKIIGAVETALFKLATLLNLKDVETINSLQPILANILSDPLLLGLTLAVIIIIPYTIHKIKTAYTEKEKRLDALLRELDDEDEGSEKINVSDPLQDQKTNEPSFNRAVTELDDEGYGNEFESQSSQKTATPQEDHKQTSEEIFKNRSILDKDFGWESDTEEWGELYDYVSKPFQIDTSNKESDSSTVSQKNGASVTVPEEQEKTVTTPNDIDQISSEIKDDDFGWESDHDEWDELYDYVSGKPFETDDQSATDSPREEALPVSKEPLDISSPKMKQSIPSEIKEDPVPVEETSSNIDHQSLEKRTDESSNIGIDELATLIEDETILEVDSINETLAEEEETIERTLDDAEDTSNIGIDELASLIEEEDIGVSINKASVSTQNVLEETKELPVPITRYPAVPERIELTLEEVEPGLESKIVAQGPITESLELVKTTPSAGPLLNSMLNSSVSAKTDALVSRLKTFQAELETRFQSLENEDEKTAEAAPAETLRKKQGNYQPANLSYQSKQKSRSNKEYLRQLESFIFMARQKSNKNTES